MTNTSDWQNFEFGDEYGKAFAGKRVLVTGSGKEGGLGHALALAAAANGAKVVGVHFHSSHKDAFDLVAAIRERGVDAFALQADVTSLADLWASRSYIIEQMGNKTPDIIVCNSGMTERGYRFGRAIPIEESESLGERRARVRRSFMENLTESKVVLDTKIDGFVSWTHLWAAEAVYHEQPLQLIYVSSMQAIEPGMAVPGYVVANWAVLRLPEVLRVNLGKASNMVSASCIMLPFIRTSMTQEYAGNPKVFGRWQSRMLEPFEAAKSVTQLLLQPAGSVNLGNYKLNVSGPADALKTAWSQVRLEVQEDALDWRP